MSKGPGCEPFFRTVARAPNRRSAIESSSTRSFTAQRPAFPGAITPNGSARGSRSTIASPTGQTEACGSLSSRSFNSNTMRSAPSSTGQESERIKTLRAQGGDPMQCSGPLSRRFFIEAPRPCGYPRAAAPHCADPREHARLDDGAGADCTRARSFAHRRHWI